MGLTEDLGRGTIGVDTALFIYFIEEHPQFLRLIEPLFVAADEGKRELVTSHLRCLRYSWCRSARRMISSRANGWLHDRYETAALCPRILPSMTA